MTDNCMECICFSYLDSRWYNCCYMTGSLKEIHEFMIDLVNLDLICNNYCSIFEMIEK